MKKLILQLIAIKLKKETHDKLSGVMTKVSYVAFFIILSFGLYNSVSKTVEAKSILKNGTVTDVNVSLVEEFDENATKYFYSYNFNADGRDVKNRFFAAESMREKWGKASTVEFMFLPENPEGSMPVATLEKDSRVGGLAKHFFTLVIVVGLVVWLSYTFLTSVLVIPKKNT